MSARKALLLPHLITSLSICMFHSWLCGLFGTCRFLLHHLMLSFVFTCWLVPTKSHQQCGKKNARTPKHFLGVVNAKASNRTPPLRVMNSLRPNRRVEMLGTLPSCNTAAPGVPWLRRGSSVSQCGVAASGKCYRHRRLFCSMGHLTPLHQ